MKKLISDSLEFFLELLFPSYCCACKRLGSFLCSKCYGELEFTPLPVRLKLEECALDQVWAATKYQPPISKVIGMMKYGRVRGVANFAAELMYTRMQLPKVDAITAVPLHRKRQAWRGFNQAEEVARGLARYLDIPYLPLLIRSQNTASQASQAARHLRLISLTQAFKTNPHFHQTIPRSILLVDDVITTGTTLNECAKVLKTLGVHQIYGLAVAHGG